MSKNTTAILYRIPRHDRLGNLLAGRDTASLCRSPLVSDAGQIEVDLPTGWTLGEQADGMLGCWDQRGAPVVFGEVSGNVVLAYAGAGPAHRLAYRTVA